MFLSFFCFCIVTGNQFFLSLGHCFPTYAYMILTTATAAASTKGPLNVQGYWQGESLAAGPLHVTVSNKQVLGMACNIAENLHSLWLRVGMEKAMATHSSTLAWKIPWTEEPGRLQSMGLLRVPRLSDFTFTFHFRALEKEMATHSSVLAWRTPGAEAPSGLLSMGSHRVGHDWSNLAAAARVGKKGLKGDSLLLFQREVHWSRKTCWFG